MNKEYEAGPLNRKAISEKELIEKYAKSGEPDLIEAKMKSIIKDKSEEEKTELERNIARAFIEQKGGNSNDWERIAREEIFKKYPYIKDIEKILGADSLTKSFIEESLSEDFLLKIPKDISYSSSRLVDSSFNSLFAIKDGKVKEISLSSYRHKTFGYAYVESEKKEGNTYLSALIENGKMCPFDALVRVWRNYVKSDSNPEKNRDYWMTTIMPFDEKIIEGIKEKSKKLKGIEFKED